MLNLIDKIQKWAGEISTYFPNIDLDLVKVKAVQNALWTSSSAELYQTEGAFRYLKNIIRSAPVESRFPIK